MGLVRKRREGEMIEGESLNHYEEKDGCQEGDGCMEDRERKNY